MASKQTSTREQQLRQEMVGFCHWLSRLGYTPGTSGNLSVRLAPERILVTPTGISKGLVKTSDMVIVDLSGRLLNGTRNVTTEISMHLAVYKGRPDTTAVVHAHPATATAFACSGRALDEMLCQEAAMTLGCVPLARYATTGTQEVAVSLRPYLEKHDAILLANHGVITYGCSLVEAFMRMETVEHIAQVTLLAHQLGTPHLLSTDQLIELRYAKAKYTRNASGPTEESSLLAKLPRT
jgi:L-fuculose-phosphate aldolase